MAGPSFNSTLIARLAQAVYGYKLGAATMGEALAAAAPQALGNVGALMNVLYTNDLAGLTTQQVAARVVTNLGVPTSIAAEATAVVAGMLTAAAPATRGEVLLNIVNQFSALTTHPVLGSAARQFNTDVAAAVAYGQTAGTLDFNLGGGVLALDSSVAGVMRLTGNHNLRIDITRNTDQITAVDLNRNGFFDINGRENVPSATTLDDGKKFVVVDAYTRNALDATDLTKNYQGSIFFDGTAFNGDGVSTNGTIFLGGIGADQALSGVGNDFLAGGGAVTTGVVNGQVVIVSGPGALPPGSVGGVGATADYLFGGRNADMFFMELSRLSATDGNNIDISGGTTSDDTTALGAVPAGGLRSQDQDTLLLEASDDDEPVTVTLDEGTNIGPGGILNNVTTASGRSAETRDVESVNASGNLYGFLNNFNTVVGARAYDGYNDAHTVGKENYGRGSTGQIHVIGTAANNLVIAGYDNDKAEGLAGNDLLMGGDLRFLITNRNNPNLLDANGGLTLNVGPTKVVSDGRDILLGGNDNDALAYEAGSGTVDGQAHFDTVYVTDYSVGRIAGTNNTADGLAAQNAALAALTTDSIIRLDLANGAGAQFRDYGGANRGLGAGPAEAATADQTNYAAAMGAKPATTTVNVEGVITTGLGDVDYLVSGTNNPELVFNNKQNYSGSNARYDVRGISTDGVSTTKFGNYWTDANFGLDDDGSRLVNLAAGGGGSLNGTDGATTGVAGVSGVAFRDPGDNVVYLSQANDTIEGRDGDDETGGGLGDDNFMYAFGDDVDIIRRQQDKDKDNWWDTDAAGNPLYQQDFRADPSGITATRLLIDFGTTDLTSVNTVVGSVLLQIDPGKASSVKLNSGDLSTFKSITSLADAVNKAFNAIDSGITVSAVGNALLVQDSKGRDISDTAAEGYAVFVSISNSQASTTATLNPGGAILQENDRVLFMSYDARLSNTLRDDINGTAEMVEQAQDLVVGLGPNTTLAQGQAWRIQLQNVQPGDKVSINVNGQIIERVVGFQDAGGVIVDDADKNGVVTTDEFVAGLVTQINTDLVDRHTGAGDLAAAQTDVIVVGGNSADESVLILTQNAVGAAAGNTKVYMNAPVVTITAANAGTSSALSALANTSDTSIELFGYNGANGNLNANNVLFLGRSGQATLSTDKSTALLHVAKDTGETIVGKDANAARGFQGDDQFIGGLGNDDFSGGTGDDRYYGSWGTDKFTGGGSTASTVLGTVAHTDSAIFDEMFFGAGTKFTIVVDPNLGTVGSATVNAVLGSKTGTTTLSGVEEVRTVSNLASDTIDFSGLSNSVAAATGASANLDLANVDVGTATGTNVNEGVRLNLVLGARAGLAWAVDRNNNDNTVDSGEIGTGSLAVFGVENVLGGAGNDIVEMDKSQAGSSNTINLAGEQPDLTPGGTFIEGRDLVIYDHGTITAASRPSIAVKVESSAGTDTVTMTSGVLGTKVVTDTLIGVEVQDYAAAATRTPIAGANDTIDLTAITGAAVNFSGAGVLVGRSLGGQVTPTSSVAAVEANTFEAGGVSLAGANLGSELLEIVGITQFERVTGSTGNDRVIVGDGAVFANVNFAAAAAAAASVPFNFHTLYDQATRAFTTKVTVENNGLYGFNLGTGDDALDWRASEDGIAVVPDFTAADSDRIVVDANNDGTFFDHAALDRIDTATGVERYFAANLTAAKNIIDLSKADAATTVTFGAETKELGNEVKDPNGTDPNAGATKTPDNQVTGINVSTATMPSVARFMQASANAATTQGAYLWGRIEGSNFADTILFSPTQDRNADEILNLRGGANTVDYTNGVVAGQSDAYTLAVSDYAAVANKGKTATHGGNTVTHTSNDTGAADTDTISLDRQTDVNGVPVDGSLLVIGSTNTQDSVTIAALLDATHALGSTGTKFGSSTAVKEATIWTDIVGTVGGGHNRVDLGSGAGVTTGTIVQDVAITVVGGTSDAGGTTPYFNDNVTTSIKAFENATGSGFADRIFGNDNDNVLDGGGGNDLLQGRGGADNITGGAGDDRVIYVGPGDSGHVLTKLTATGFDTLTDFDDAGADLFVVDRVAGWGSLAGNGALIDAAATIDASKTNIGFFLLAGDDKLASNDRVDMTKVAAAVTLAGAAGNVTKGEQFLFALDTTDSVSVYVWEATADNDATIDAAELRLLTVIDDTDIDAADGADKLTLSDVVMRFGAQGGQQLNQAFLAGVREELAYSSLAQSQYGAIDSIGRFVAGVLTDPFVQAEDRIDLSAFNLAAQGALAINRLIVRDRTGAGNQITDANANDFFVGADGVRRAAVLEFDNDDIDGGAVGVQARARLFVDLNGDGQLSTTQDLFLDFATAGTVALGTLETGVGNGNVPGFLDIIWGT